MNLDSVLRPALAERSRLDRYRRRYTLESAQQVYVSVEGQTLINFCSNDYLGLANHPELVNAFQHASRRYGVGSGASHLVCGHSVEHHALEQELAAFTGRDRALLFSTGYMANLGVLQALVDRNDAVFEDKLNHASLIDGAILSRAEFVRYRHADSQHLSLRLQKSSARRKLIVTDGVFSMDGNTAPLNEIADIATRNNAWLMVDDAHGFGCMGATGAGLQEQCQLGQNQLPILMGTLGKSFGAAGAFVAGSDTLIETLIQFSRSYIYTTAMPPAVAAAGRSALKLMQTEAWRRSHLHTLIKQFKHLCHARGLSLMPSDSPIQPMIIGSDEHALALSAYLRKAGFWVSAIRPPTVPEGTARLRFTLTAGHSEEHIVQVVAALAEGLEHLGLTERVNAR